MNNTSQPTTFPTSPTTPSHCKHAHDSKDLHGFRFGTSKELRQDKILLACELWDLMDYKQRAQILYDLPDQSQKETAFYQAIQDASLACFFIPGHSKLPHAAAWAKPACTGAQTWVCHFAFAGYTTPAQRLHAAQLFLQRLANLATMIIALIPKAWLGTRRLIQSLGFKHIITLPKVCPLTQWHRLSDGCFYIYESGKS